jgi:mono/diheme cytochrome c family protein
MAVLVLLFVGMGVFNVSAKDKHWDITMMFLNVVKERSIAVRSGDIVVPESLLEGEALANGAKNYDAMCSQCHLSPVLETSELNAGLYPKPPVFDKENHALHDLAEIYWVIKNGIKMSAMPAWGDFHTEQQLWDMVAFVSQLKGMSAIQYSALVGEGGHSHKEGAHETTPKRNATAKAEHMDGDDHHASDTVEKMMKKTKVNKKAGHYDDGHSH